MSRQFFTEEQIESLRQNPYVYSVSAIVLVLRKEFKEIFYAEYKEGALPREILRKYGFDPSILGKGRISSIEGILRRNMPNTADSTRGRRPADRSEAAKAAGKTARKRNCVPSGMSLIYAAGDGVFKKNFRGQNVQKVGGLLMNQSSCVFEIIEETLQNSEKDSPSAALCEIGGVSRSVLLCLGQSRSSSTGPGRTGPQRF